MLGVIGVIISLALLMYLAYRGITVLVLAPILALFATIMSEGANAHIMATYTEIFMKAFAGFCKSYFPVFLLGAIFGKLMDDSGAAKAIAHAIAKKLGKDKAIPAVVLSCAVLTYGGVSLFVVAFAVFPIATQLFKEADIPKRLIPGSIGLGAFSFTMTALPGTPQIQNAIPMPFFGTDAYAAPALGIIAAVLMCGGGLFWLNYRAKKAAAAGEGYGDHPDENVNTIDVDKLPNVWLSMVPIIIVLVLNYVLGKVYFAGTDMAYLKDYGTDLGKVKGIWSLIISLVIAIIFTIVSNINRLKEAKKTVNQGAIGSLLAITNTSSEVGYGNVIQSLAAFLIIKNAILGISSNPLVSEAISVNVLAGITGSASGGMSIALGVLGKQYLELAQANGINPEVLHRIAALASGGLDTLPHNGAVITLLGICGLTHKESYKDIGMCSVVIPLCTLIIVLIFASLGVV
ncbi:GntP family permease [Clostridium sp. MB40-C1]|uniref:GntP family permease n=1 Tax=Clostridium sp. MB40-C1 TaxID=3070996 RepID=UPI0027DFB75D|nr:GntP family permease [Clostridium sp. MB40-C1]WMJ79499.1 GntP family permease [Clostridium sp. MB40-C1]